MKKIVLIIVFVFMGIQAFAQAPTNGAVAYFNFENNLNSHSASHVLANAGSSNIAYTTGRTGQGLNFTGTQALSNLTIPATLTGNFTIAWWEFRPTQPQNYSSSFELNESLYYRFQTSTSCGGSPRANAMEVGTLSGGSWRCETLQNFSTLSGGWHHIAIVQENSDIKYYEDGMLLALKAMAPIATGTQKFILGGGTNSGAISSAKYMLGKIDELYIYNRALTATEMQQVQADTNGPIPEPAIVSSDVLFMNTTAQLTNVFNANNLNTTVTLNWGNASNSLTNSVPLGSISGSSNTEIVTNINGLTAGNTYYYQLVMTSANGTTNSSIYSFTNSKVEAFRFNNTFISEDGTHSLSAGPSGIVPAFVPDRAGNANSAVFLSNYEALVSAAIPGLPVGSAKRSVSFWFKRARTTPAEAHNIFQWGTETAQNAYGVTILDDNRIVNFGWQDDLFSQSATALNTNWDHYVVTYSDNGTVNMYKNGSLIRTGSKTWNTIGNVLTLGSKCGSCITNIYGHLDDFELYRTTLTPAQVTSLYGTGTALSTQDFNSQNLKATLYPNPAKDILNIETQNEVKTIEIYSLQGQKVLSAKDKNVNVANLSKGIYMVRIEDAENAVSTKKLVIE